MTVHKLLEKLEKIHNVYFLTFLFFLTFLCYTNTLGNGLFYDDEDFIYNNIYVKNFSIDKYFTENVIAGTGKVSNYYRPILLLGYGLEYKTFGNLPFIYHLNNLLLHGVASMLLFLLLKKLFHNNFIAVFTSILFIIHPIQTEAVSYASGRGDPLSAVFLFLSLLFYLERKPLMYFLSAITLVFALLSKETALIAPGLFILITFFQRKSIKKMKTDAPFLILIISLTLSYFLLRLTALNFQNTLNFYGGDNIYTTNILVRLLTFLSILPIYIGLLFFPKTLFIDRDVPIITGFTPMVILSLIIICILMVFTIRFYKKYPLFLFSFLWFFITFIPASGIVPINGIMYEHFLYLPSIGIFLAFSYGCFLCFQKITKSLVQVLLILFLGICFLLLVGRTIVRNTDWHDPITFYNQVLKHNPNSARVHNNLAMAYAEAQIPDKAISEYKKAILLNDVYPQTHYNLANVYISLNKISEAEYEYNKAIQIDPNFYRAYIALYQIYQQTGEEKKRQKLLDYLELNKNKIGGYEELLRYLQSL